MKRLFLLNISEGRGTGRTNFTKLRASQNPYLLLYKKTKNSDVWINLDNAWNISVEFRLSYWKHLEQSSRWFSIARDVKLGPTLQGLHFFRCLAWLTSAPYIMIMRERHGSYSQYLLTCPFARRTDIVISKTGPHGLQYEEEGGLSPQDGGNEPAGSDSTRNWQADSFAFNLFHVHLTTPYARHYEFMSYVIHYESKMKIQRGNCMSCTTGFDTIVNFELFITES